MSKIQYYIADVESTGLSPSKHEVVQLSIIRCSDRVQTNKLVKAEYPQHADSRALEVIGRSRLDITRGISKEDAVEYFNDFFAQDGVTPEHRCMVAHKAQFDRKFCYTMWEKCGEIFPANLWMCTVDFTRGYTVTMGISKPKLTLEASCGHLGIKPKLGAHDALVDTQNTYVLWSKLMKSGLDHLNYIKREPHKLANSEGDSEVFDY